MKNEAFEELIESVREMKAIMRGEENPARVFEFKEPDVAALRARFGASQREFAELIGISARTLQEWEQGRRKPQGPARVLLLVADKDPRAIIEAVHPLAVAKGKKRKSRLQPA